MTVELIELGLGLYFIGVAISITKAGDAGRHTMLVDKFKLAFGILLTILALLQGVKLF